MRARGARGRLFIPSTRVCTGYKSMHQYGILGCTRVVLITRYKVLCLMPLQALKPGTRVDRRLRLDVPSQWLLLVALAASRTR